MRPGMHQYFICQKEKCRQKRGQKVKAYKQDPSYGYSKFRIHLRTCVGEDFEQVYLSY